MVWLRKKRNLSLNQFSNSSKHQSTTCFSAAMTIVIKMLSCHDQLLIFDILIAKTPENATRAFSVASVLGLQDLTNRAIKWW
jgi:hypothetical protein